MRQYKSRLAIGLILATIMLRPIVSVASKSGKTNGNITVQRISGINRYSTNAKVSNKAIETAETIVITSGENYADSLTASALVGQVNGSLLLTEKDNTNKEVKEEIERLAPKKAYIVGGENSISEKTVENLNIEETVRLSGKDRYETSEIVSKEVIAQGGNTNELIIASGEN